MSEPDLGAWLEGLANDADSKMPQGNDSGAAQLAEYSVMLARFAAAAWRALESAEKLLEHRNISFDHARPNCCADGLTLDLEEVELRREAFALAAPPGASTAAGRW